MRAPQASKDIYASRWLTLRFAADVLYGENYRSDLSRFLGVDEQYLIVGRWGPWKA